MPKAKRKIKKNYEAVTNDFEKTLLKQGSA